MSGADLGRGRGRGGRRGRGRRGRGSQKGTPRTPGREAAKNEQQPFSEDLTRPGSTSGHTEVVQTYPHDRSEVGIARGPVQDGQSAMARSTATPRGTPHHLSEDSPQPGNTSVQIPVVPTLPQVRTSEEGIIGGRAQDGKSAMARRISQQDQTPHPLSADFSRPGNNDVHIQVVPAPMRIEEGIVRDPAQDGQSTLARSMASPHGTPHQPTTKGGDARMFPSPHVASASYGQPRQNTSSPKSFVKPVKKGPTNHYGKKQPPDRPGHGSEGREIVVHSNYFPLRLPRHITIHHYDVATVPVKLPKSVSRLVYEEFQKRFLDGYVSAYDGCKSAYFSRQPFKGERYSQAFQFSVEAGEKEREFTVTLQKAAKFDIDRDRLKEILSGASESMPALQALDVILRHLPSLKMQLIGRSFFTRPQQPFALGMGREVWPGYYQSVRPVMGWKMMLNIDMATTAFYTEQSVFDFMCMNLRRCSPRDATNPVSDRDRQEFSKRELNQLEHIKFCREIKGIKIVVSHLPYKRKYKVVGLTRLTTRNQTFSREDGSACTVENYFREIYPNAPIRHPLLPCLHVGQKTRNIYLPIDVCTIVGGQRCMKKLSDLQTANMIRHTAKPAYEREQVINTTVKRAAFNDDLVVKEFGIGVDSKMVEVCGRVLNPPRIVYNSGAVVTPPHNKGCWDMRSKTFFRGVTVKKWAVVCSIYQNRDNNCGCERFISQLQKQSSEMGMNMMAVPIFKHVGRKAVEHVFNDLVSCNSNLDLVIVIINPGGTDYQDVKRLGDSESGKAVATQCLLSKTVLDKCNPATLGNICLKINARLGGVNSFVDLGTRPSLIKGVPIIIFGADVTHPRSDDTTSPSIASVVASVDLEGGRYRAIHRNQKHRQEIIADLTEMTKEHLKAFRRSTRHKPMKIIFYRDGVSEGQFDAVRLDEIAALQRACEQLEPTYQPKITFIVVQKRHHTRFFPKSKMDEVGRGKNVPPGTMVDRTITHPSQFDFYLCSHIAIQGTSRPCHYHVLWDDSDFTANELQSFSYQLCHMFWRCNRSVSYPAPTYYAHHDAAHARMLLQAACANSSSAASSSSSSETLPKDQMDSAIKIHEDRKEQMYFI